MSYYRTLGSFMQLFKYFCSMLYTSAFMPKSGHRYLIYITCSAFPGTVTVSHAQKQVATYTVTNGSSIEVTNGGYVAIAEDQPFIILTSHNTDITVNFRVYQANLHVFDDNKRKTISFDEKNNRWSSQYTYYPDGWASVGNMLLSFKNGKVYKHNSANSYNTFYGKYNPSIVCAVHNEPSDQVKIYTHVSVEGTNAPSYLHLRTERPFVQSTDVYESEFLQKEGVFNAPIMRDRLSQGTTSYEQNMIKGDLVRGQIAKAHLEFNEQTTKLVVNKYDLGFNISKGLNK